ncbi:MAG: putative inorganic carbon transporter subunit DabA, partial [Myxococcota bacterium]
MPGSSAKAGSSTPAAQPTDPKQHVATADAPNSELGERDIEETEKIEQREALDPVMVERIDRASRRIAPAWPLDRMIAVNPYWGFRDRPIESASAQLEGVAGSRLVMPHHYYLQLFQKGAFKLEHIAAALNERDIALEPETVVDRLKRPEPAPKQRETVADLLHPERALTRGMSTREYIVDSISRFCAGYFTRKNPNEDLYVAWRQEIRNDLRPRWAGLPDMRRAPLAPTAEEMIALTLRELDVADAEQEDYLTTLLFDVVGWAS